MGTKTFGHLSNSSCWIGSKSHHGECPFHN